MLSFIGRSIIQKIVTLFLVSIVSFLIVYLAPGKPSQVDPLNPRFTPEIIERFRKAFHLDKPLHIQYLYYHRDLFTGKTVSWKDNQPVLSKIWERFLSSLEPFSRGLFLFPSGSEPPFSEEDFTTALRPSFPTSSFLFPVSFLPTSSSFLWSVTSTSPSSAWRLSAWEIPHGSECSWIGSGIYSCPLFWVP